MMDPASDSDRNHRAAAGAPDAHFGDRTVPIEDKQRLVDEVFSTVAQRYDLMNDLMSGGLHRAWKDALVTAVDPPRSDRPFRLIDVAGGTGDIAFRVLTHAGLGTRASVIDVNPNMLAVGRQRALERGVESRVDFVVGTAEALPLTDRSYDTCSMAFGIRNVPRIEQALAEAFRVLRPGGRFVCLEFSNVDVPGLEVLYDFYSFNVIPALGRMVVGDAEPYRYLVESIRRFPTAEQFATMLRDQGFRRVAYRVMSGGIVALHWGWRL